jgi:hypothetical protein
MNIPQTKRVMAAAFAALVLTGCMATTPYWDAHLGETVDLAKAQQIKDPDAGKKHPAPDGLDGVAAKQTMDRYHHSFHEVQQQPDIFTIGVSGSGSSGGGSR